MIFLSYASPDEPISDAHGQADQLQLYNTSSLVQVDSVGVSKSVQGIRIFNPQFTLSWANLAGLVHSTTSIIRNSRHNRSCAWNLLHIAHLPYICKRFMRPKSPCLAVRKSRAPGVVSPEYIRNLLR